MKSLYYTVLLSTVLVLSCRKPPVGDPHGTFPEYKKAVHLEAVAEGSISEETKVLAEAVKELDSNNTSEAGERSLEELLVEKPQWQRPVAYVLARQWIQKGQAHRADSLLQTLKLGKTWLDWRLQLLRFEAQYELSLQDSTRRCRGVQEKALDSVENIQNPAWTEPSTWKAFELKLRAQAKSCQSPDSLQNWLLSPKARGLSHLDFGKFVSALQPDSSKARLWSVAWWKRKDSLQARLMWLSVDSALKTEPLEVEQAEIMAWIHSRQGNDSAARMILMPWRSASDWGLLSQRLWTQILKQLGDTTLNQELAFLDSLSQKPKKQDLGSELWVKAFEAEQRASWDTALATYQQLIQDFPGHSRTAQSQMRSGLIWLKQGRCDSALSYWRDLKKIPSLMEQGAARVFSARCYWTMGQESSAVQILKAQIDDHPNLFWSWRSRQLLQDWVKDTLQTTQSELISMNDLQAEKWMRSQVGEGVWKSKNLFPKSWLEAFLAMGEWDLADAMVAQHRCRKACDQEPGFADLYEWSHLSYRYGHSALGYRIAQRMLGVFPRQALGRLPKQVALLFYPMPYASEVAMASQKFGVDSMLVWGVMRQESMFDPEIRSPANAIGLLQIIPATGRFLADSLKIQSWATEKLTNPSYNVRLGTYYISQLLQEHSNPIYAIAHYNAGPGPSKRWERASAGLDLDLAVEEISFWETRGYVKKVLANYWTYQALYGKP